MRSSIGHLHVRYRGIGSLGAAGVPRVRSILEGEFLEELESCLERALHDDRFVYVVRRVRCELTIGGLTRVETARRAAERVTQAIITTILDGTSSDVIRFASEGAYLSRFVTDLLRGDAGGQWYYRPLRRFESMPVSDAIVRIVREHPDSAPELLAHLHAAGVVSDLVERIGPRGLASLLEPIAEAPGCPTSARPIFAAVIPMYEAVAPRRSTGEYEAVFDTWTLAHGEAIDWQSRASLTDAAASMLTALLACVDVRPALDASLLEAALSQADWLDAYVLRELLSRLAGPGRDGVERVLTVLGRVGIVDRGLATERLITSLVAEGQTQPAGIIQSLRRRGLVDSVAADLTANRLIDAGVDPEEMAVWATVLGDQRFPGSGTPRRPTPEMDQLLADLRVVIRGERLVFRGAAGDHVRLYAALVHRKPQWMQRSALVASTIEWIASAPAQALTQAGREIAQALNGADSRSASTAREVETASAGIFLLLRAVADTRLAHLAQSLRYPAGGHPFASLLTSLAVHWSVPGDPAPFLLVVNAPPLDEIRAEWAAMPPADHTSFQAALLRLLSTQRLMGAAALRVQVVGEGEDSVVLGGCDLPGLWSFASRPQNRTIEAIVSDWVERWEAATGVRPEVVYEGTTETTAAAWSALAEAGVGVADADVSLTSIAHSVVRLWARWLRQFAGSGAPYLLHQFIRRRGFVAVAGDEIVVQLERKPLDVVLEMAGYCLDLDPIPGVFDRRVRFRWLS